MFPSAFFWNSTKSNNSRGPSSSRPSPSAAGQVNPPGRRHRERLLRSRQQHVYAQRVKFDFTGSKKLTASTMKTLRREISLQRRDSASGLITPVEVYYG